MGKSAQATLVPVDCCGNVALGDLDQALAGPPYRSDDPEPTDYRHYEIYAFTDGIVPQDGASGAGGVDFNYGGAPNLQLTATFPIAYAFPNGGSLQGGLSNIELAAKYRFLTKDNVGFDAAIFPRVFLPSASPNVGQSHASFLFPVWLQKDWDKWSAFGGGGCEINRGGNSQDFCLAGLVVTNQITSNLQVGMEIFHQTPDTQGSSATTSIGTGVRYDLNDHYHLLGYLGRGIQNAQTNDRLMVRCRAVHILAVVFVAICTADALLVRHGKFRPLRTASGH